MPRRSTLPTRPSRAPQHQSSRPPHDIPGCTAHHSDASGDVVNAYAKIPWAKPYHRTRPRQRRGLHHARQVNAATRRDIMPQRGFLHDSPTALRPNPLPARQAVRRVERGVAPCCGAALRRPHQRTAIPPRRCRGLDLSSRVAAYFLFRPVADNAARQYAGLKKIGEMLGRIKTIA